MSRDEPTVLPPVYFKGLEAGVGQLPSPHRSWQATARDLHAPWAPKFNFGIHFPLAVTGSPTAVAPYYYPRSEEV